MIIYGSRMYGKKNKISLRGLCEHCGNKGDLLCYDARSFGHIYWIPLIPLGGPVRVIKECSRCSRGLHFPQKNIPELLDRLTAEVKLCAAAALAGKTSFNIASDADSQSQQNIGPFLFDVIETLTTMGKRDDVDDLVAIFNGGGADYAVAICAAARFFLIGNYRAALKHLNEAYALRSDDAFIPYQRGVVYALLNDQHRAIEEYRLAISIAGPDLMILVELIAAYEAAGLPEEAADTMAECLRVAPDLAGDKAFMKAVKKAHKKLGRPLPA